ncbi:MAG: TolB family protein, partial [Anaerolineales bacterium]
PGSVTPIPTTVVPILWQDLGLTGRILFVEGAQRLADLDLASGELRTLFQAPFGGWVTSASVSPDGRSIALAYSEPPPPGEMASYTGIYLLPADGSSDPTPLLLPPGPEEAYFNPAFAPDGTTLYLVRLQRTPDDPIQPFRQSVARVRLVEGEVELLVDDAFWPSLSPDGFRLAYVTIDPDDFTNTLFLADSGGGSAAPAVEPGFLPYLDSPVFSRDSNWLYFSAVGTGRGAGASWLDRLLGVVPAQAHSLPSDWWRVPVRNGPPERLTDLGQSGLFEAFSPDGRHFAFLSSSGLYAMDPNGLNLTPLLNTWASGSLDWIP